MMQLWDTLYCYYFLIQLLTTLKSYNFLNIFPDNFIILILTSLWIIRRKRSSDESDLAEPDPPVGGAEAHGLLHGAGARFARDLRDNSAVVKVRLRDYLLKLYRWHEVTWT